MRFLTYAFLAPAALLAARAPAALLAQEVVQALPGTTDADRLAEQIRALAANPRDLNALIAAADLSLSLGDLSGAASLFARAEKVSASDPRIKAGEGSILVRSERPGEALRYFSQAEAAGYDARGYAADRGLAYDLIGQQERAQRDYRLALKTRADDEIVKRYALSLGISGKRDAALEQLDPLLRKSDRSAWRVRAFILAMGGDQAGAEKIAITMLPSGMAQGLLPFFRRLPTLPATDRAFAVHFGEVRGSPERFADARLAPPLPQLTPDTPPPVGLAAIQPATAAGKKDRRRRGGRDREAAQPVALAANAVRSTPPAVAPSAPSTPSYENATAALARVQPLPPRAAPVTLASTSAAPPALPASGTGAGVTRPAPTTAEAANLAALAKSSPATPPPVAGNAAQALVATQTPVQTAALPTRQQAAPTPGFTSASEPSIAAVATPVGTGGAVPTESVAIPAVAAARADEARPGAATPAQTVDFSAPPSRAEADSVLARIVAGLSIPAAELGIVEPAKAAPVTAVPAADTTARVLAEAQAKEARDAAAEKALAIKTAAEKRAADRKAASDKAALAAKKLANEKKLAEAKAAAEEKKAARANPARIWVQVAGGAYAGDLPKAFAAVKAKAPAVFGSRGGWSTPLRATNRVLTGPFTSNAEARAFVNALAKEDVSAFTFTSDAGQAVTKLPGK